MQYYQRRIDQITDDRMEKMEARLASLETRINTLFGVLSVLVIVANLIGPTIIHYVLGVP